LEFTNSLNQREKQELIIKLRKDGKTYREIAHIAKVSLRDIKPTLRKYERKLQTKKGEENKQKTTTKKLSKRIQAYDLFRNGKTQDEVAIDLELDYERVRKYWTEFLRLKNMKKLYNIYIESEYHLDYIFRIYYFMLRNKIDFKNMENILRVANDTAKLYQNYSNLKAEIEKLEQMKNSYLSNQNTNYQQLLPLGLPKHYYEYLL